MGIKGRVSHGGRKDAVILGNWIIGGRKWKEFFKNLPGWEGGCCNFREQDPRRQEIEGGTSHGES